MPRIPHPLTPSEREIHEQSKWLTREVYRFYAEQRKENCTYLELMDLWLWIPYCEACIQSHPWHYDALPDVWSDSWEEDLLQYVDEERLTALVNGSFVGEPIRCYRCATELEPWNGNDIFIVAEHVEERFGVPMQTPGRQNPSRKLRKAVLNAYGNECFHCHRSDVDLTIDHIVPRSQDGDAAFRNLQPLCEDCNNRKGDQVPEEVGVYSTMYFNGPPSDAWEGMFW